MAKPTRIDALLREQYPFLREEDECYAFLEYTAGAGYGHGATNNLISNLKKGMDRKGTAEWPHKLQAIDDAARVLASLDGKWLGRATLVPIPPSVTEDDPAHDDRLWQVLLRLSALTGLNLDIRKLLYQSESTRSSSRSPGQRLTLPEFRQVYRLDEELTPPRPTRLVVVDDLLTTGAHFRVAKEVLLEEWSGIPVIGIFLARTVR